MNVFTGFVSPSKVQVPVTDFVARMNLQVLQAPPSACLWFCGRSLFTSPSKALRCPKCMFLILQPFSHTVSTKSNSLGFLQISRSTKSTSYLFTSGPLHLPYKISLWDVKAKLLWNLIDKLLFLKKSPPLKILRAKISGMLGASLQFQKLTKIEPWFCRGQSVVTPCGLIL